MVIVTQSMRSSETRVFLLKIRRKLGMDAGLGSFFSNNSLSLKLVLFILNVNICQNLHFWKVNK